MKNEIKIRVIYSTYSALSFEPICYSLNERFKINDKRIKTMNK
jgi:hypothetical protein